MVSDPGTLEARTNDAFAAGDNQLGLSLLRELSSQRPEDANVYYRLAVIEEQIGLPENTTKAYLKCLEFAPNNPLSYLYTGHWFQHQGNTSKALSIYSLGADIDEGILSLWQNQTQSGETRMRSAAANRLMREQLTQMHKHSVGYDKKNRRIADAIWTRTHDIPFKIANPAQIPQLFYIPGLSAEPFAVPDRQSHQWLWVNQLEKSAEAIKQELLATLPRVIDQGRPYLPDGIKLDEGFNALIGSLNWTALDLYVNGQINQDVARHFPVTLKALSCSSVPASGPTSADVPLYQLNEAPFEVFFSLLKAGQHIKPHYGQSNHSLTVHLPLLVPQNCWLNVGEKKHIWREGKLVIFDDTFEHEAMNGSQADRIVLIFSIWHPDLSSSEKEAIRQTFKARQDWRDSRRIPS